MKKKMHLFKTSFIFLFFSLGLLSCKSKQSYDLKSLCLEIRNTPESNTANLTDDKKRKLIQEFENFKSDEACDSLKAIFLSLKSWDYIYRPLNFLADYRTKKSLLVLSEIIRDYPLENPANMFFIWDLNTNTENVSVMFPNLAKSLGKQKWTDSDVLSIIINSHRKGNLSREQLESSKDYLINFYDYIKVKKDTIGDDVYDTHTYDTHVTDLLRCLRIFEPEERINKIYRDALTRNASFPRFCTVDFAEYNNISKRKIKALFQAALGLAQNDQPVEEKYLELITAEPLYHNEFYAELKELNKQSIFPKKYLRQESFAISDLAYCKENGRDADLPDCLDFLGKRVVPDGNNKGVYYFYNAKYQDDNEIVVEVSGPQPLQLNQFVLQGKKTKRIYGGQAEKNEVDAKIDELIKNLDK